MARKNAVTTSRPVTRSKSDTNETTEDLEKDSDTKKSPSNSQNVFFIDRTNKKSNAIVSVPNSSSIVDVEDTKINDETDTESDSDSESDCEMSLQAPAKKIVNHCLASSLRVGPLPKLYVDLDSCEHLAGKSAVMPRLEVGTQQERLMQKSILTAGIEKAHSLPPYEESIRQQKKHRQAEKEKSKGKNWFDMNAPEMTEERKNDLMVLHMRRALNPKQFYKAPDLKTLPKFFQMGRVVDNPVDFYHSRIPKKQRKKTLVDELLEDADFRKFNKRKYEEIQESKAKNRGPYKHMKRMKKKKK